MAVIRAVQPTADLLVNKHRIIDRRLGALDRQVTGITTMFFTRAPEYSGPLTTQVEGCSGISSLIDNLDLKSGIYVAASSCMIAARPARSVMHRNAVSWSRRFIFTHALGKQDTKSYFLRTDRNIAAQTDAVS